MIGDLYEWVKLTLVGSIPMEFEFVIPILVIFIVILIIYCAFAGFCSRFWGSRNGIAS